MRNAMVVAGLLLTVQSVQVSGAECTARSGAATLPLVELYTSEGCSSCPPAERWLSGKFPAPAADAAAATLAFHVDYWDDLGWRDRYASRSYTERQQRIAAANHSTFTFTPQVVLQGRNAPAWSSAKLDDDAARVRATPAVATITVTVQPVEGGYSVVADAAVDASVRRDQQVLYVAFTDGGHDINVRAGENNGVRLHHDHVVRTLSAGSAVDVHGVAHLATRINRPVDLGTVPTVIAFVEDSMRGAVLQALTLPVAACTPAS